ncbi:MAG: hypothetical protein FD156_1215 [Nitrospirae bacterium]|nr:MAG: hypothetical protein FD156_1215 [Nitrospirota bacterium]
MAAKKLVSALRIGTFKDSNGEEHTFDVKRLDAIASAYNPQFNEAPEVIGHPKTDDPAWGWIKSFKREGDILFYEYRDRVPAFQQMIDLKMFKHRSIKLGADGITVKHVGWLGAKAPAVKGLPVTFKAEDEGVTIEFSEDEGDIGVMEKMKKMLMEMMDMISGKKKQADGPPEKGKMQMEEKEEGMGEIDELKKKLTEHEGKIAEFSERDSAKDAEIACLRKDLADKTAAERKQSFAAFCESKEMEGKIPPAVKPVVIEFMEILSGTQEFEFSEGDGKLKAQPVERFKTLLSGLKKTIEFSEVATKGSAGIKTEDSVVDGIASASPKEGGK